MKKIPTLFKRIYENHKSFKAVMKFLKDNDINGIVFWLDGEPKFKIERSDFGYLWGRK